MTDRLDLLCYLHDGWQPWIEPASARRGWMDQTPEGFAYRCLPLAIANSHGWVVLTSRGFRARWTGSDGRNGIEIHLDPGDESPEGPVSIFGHGVLSFHVPGILRTPPGTNLFVSGPPNDPIDGLSPLSGVIESDWSPYSFTMNWKFTRANQWVRFVAGQPFAFFFPVLRGSVESFRPEYRSLNSDPQLAADFATWDRSRRSFQIDVESSPPADPAAKWQKCYYRGMYPEDDRAFPDHQTKLRPAPFTGGPTRRPFFRSESSAPPPPTALIDTDTHLRRREWLLLVQEQQRRLATDGGGLIRVEPPTREEFLNEIYAPGRPVVIEGVASAWPATRWTVDTLATLAGDVEVEVQAGRNANPAYERHKDFHRRPVRFAEFVKNAVARPNDWYLTAYNAPSNQALLDRVGDDLGSLDTYLTHEGEHGRGMPWIGGAGSFTPLHHDLTNNLLVQLVGTKAIILVPPNQTSRLYPCEGVFSDVVDLDDPALALNWPLAKAAEGYRVDLRPGDAIFIPVGWWHQVRSRSFSVSITYTCFHWPNDAYESWPG